MKRVLLLLSTVLGIYMGIPLAAHAQQNPQFSQYMFNGLFLNPAYAGSKGYTSLSTSVRTQWTGLPGAPLSQTVGIDGNLNKKLGAGVTIMHDRLGPQRFTEATVSSAVRIDLSRKTKLAVGISLGATQQVMDGTMLTPAERDDYAIPMGVERAIRPNAKLGAYLFSDIFYAGASVGNLVLFKEGLPTDPRPHFYLTTGGIIDLGRNMKFKPSVLLKEDFSGPAALDLNAFMLFKEQIWLGASFRTTLNIFNDETYAMNTRLGNAMAAMVEFYASPRLRFGYSYDYSLNVFQNYSSHEISVGYFFLKKQYGRMLTPRYF
ncbi:PorP/SprF family type IX secretion system membrane protein [Rufibacter roseus]|uniref:Type IX secretion system membrane protein PorP/SprF n=1 Tax=Rufibacter roseus TaxID=1567108 RepID=A0ABW2DFG8_9BACT|nr:type IX secretion system membrane protein PorP/SprF [Rufibacter roseus]